jgi:DNA polymerase III psi subunit
MQKEVIDVFETLGLTQWYLKKPQGQQYTPDIDIYYFPRVSGALCLQKAQNSAQKALLDSILKVFHDPPEYFERQSDCSHLTCEWVVYLGSIGPILQARKSHEVASLSQMLQDRACKAALWSILKPYVS